MNFFNNKNKGFTLVETLIAISIFSASIVTGMVVLGQGVSDINYAKQKIVANYLAQESIEVVRNMRDTYILYDTGSPNKDFNDFANIFNSCNENNPCSFDTTQNIEDNGFIFQCSGNSQASCDVYINNGNYNNNQQGSKSIFRRIIWADTSNKNKGVVNIFTKVTWTHKSTTPQSVTLSNVLFNWVE